MQLAAHYDALWQTSLVKFRNGAFEFDPLIDDRLDKRFGITLRARLQPQVSERVQTFLDELLRLEPQQYYYPPSDRHLTLMSIISCYNGFELSQINMAAYVAVVQETLQRGKAFSIQINGITASPSCILLQGFPEDDSLGKLRNRLRENFRASGLEQTIDKRYAIVTAHSTVVRFKHSLRQPDLFLAKLQQFRDFSFGATCVTDAELVYNDWYQRAARVQVLHTFRLR